MNRVRLIVAGGIALVLIILLGWQARREHMVKACLDSGGTWSGSACGPLRIRPLIQRDLHRS
jgi:hypothetical protein